MHLLRFPLDWEYSAMFEKERIFLHFQRFQNFRSAVFSFVATNFHLFFLTMPFETPIFLAYELSGKESHHYILLHVIMRSTGCALQYWGITLSPLNRNTAFLDHLVAEIGWSWLRDDLRFSILLHQTQAFAQELEPRYFSGKNSVSSEFFPATHCWPRSRRTLDSGLRNLRTIVRLLTPSGHVSELELNSLSLLIIET